MVDEKEEGYSKELETKMHQTIKKVSQDFESLKFNTAIAAMMSLVNEFYRLNRVTKGEFKSLLILLNPVAPHMTEEIWQIIGEKARIYQTVWPEYEEEKTIENEVEIAVQVNGKVKATIKVTLEEEQDSVREKAMQVTSVKGAVENKTIVKEIYIKGKIYNIVVK